MLRSRLRLWCVVCALAVSPLRAAEPPTGVTVWGSSGRILLGELGCIACHAAGTSSEQLLVKQAPILGDVGARITPEYLRAFLGNPQQTKPGTPMPDLLHGLAAAERTETVESLVHFLAARGGPIARPAAVADAKLIAQGKTLYHAVGCVACHAPFEPPPKHKIDPNAPPPDDNEKPALKKVSNSMPLGNLALKTTPGALALFLADPLHIRPSGRMPALNLTAKEAQAIAAYLLRDQAKEAARPPAFTADPAKTARGQELFASLGCASCHDTAVRHRPERLDLALLGAKAIGVAAHDNRSPPNESPKHAIDNKVNTKYLNFGRAGSGLTITLPGPAVIVSGLEVVSANDSPARDPAAYVLEGSPDGKSFERLDARPIAEFKERLQSQVFTFDNERAFSVYRITFPKLRESAPDAMQIAEVRLLASLKPRPGVVSTLKAMALAKLDAKSAKSCLSEQVAVGRPRFELSAAQRTALVAALGEVRQARKPLEPAQRIDQMMTAFNCYACHRRGDKGGPEPDRTPYFTYEVVVDLGDEGRLPPTLHEVGAKLTKSGFADMLFDGQRYRSYMATRMPLFGRPNVGELPELFATADAGKVPAHTPEKTGRIASDGRHLVGKNMLACINCHAWNGERLPGAEGLDLVKAGQRLRPEWFHALMLDPQKFRPRTRMPSAWPGGKSFYPNIQKGSTALQIDGIWAYLSQGEKAGPPLGLKLTRSHLLSPGDEPLVFRTFVEGVGAHAILVGFRTRSHIAFDANRVRMVLAWSGDFISPDSAWEGRGGNYARLPSQDVVKFPEGPALAVLQGTNEKWPADLPKAKMGTSRTPEGWRYRGYRLDEKRQPTFLYRAGAVAVEETPDSTIGQSTGNISRRFRMRAEEDVKNFYLRVAVGKQLVEKDGIWVVDGKQVYRVSAGATAKPRIRELDGVKELLVPVTFQPIPGKKGFEAKIEVELTW